MNPLNKLLTLFHTIRHLKLKQIVYQIKRRLPKRSIRIPTCRGFQNDVNLLIPELDLNDEYIARYRVDDLLYDRVFLLNERHDSLFSTWYSSTASHLWNFNLHYLEYCVALAAKFRKTLDEKYYEGFKRIVSSWIDCNPIGVGDAWHPYTISMRIPNMIISMNILGDGIKADTRFYIKLCHSLYAQYRYLIQHLELQLGNHYLENLKSIVVGSVAFGEQDVFKKYIKKLRKEVNEELLLDGMHFELSPMYHKIILEDLLRLEKCISGDDSLFIRAWLGKMASVVEFLEDGFNRTPLFNDSGDNISKTGKALISACCAIGVQWEKRDALPDAGYYKLRVGRMTILIDAGCIGPTYIPGHGHCDCLSFEVAMDGYPVFVNSGTYQYQGNNRRYFRSTRAHNTVVIGEKEQSECWGEHRVGRRISNIKALYSTDSFEGSYRSAYGDIHTRAIKLNDDSIIITDQTETKEAARVSSFLHFGSGYRVNSVTDQRYVFKNDIVICTIDAINCKIELHTDGELVYYAPEFGILETTACLEFLWDSDDETHGYIIKYNNDGTVSG